ncbi:hypothetical protein [Tuwongella immobilis]|uniref:Uncharacterized protein n=1 Tax=Tuwongella immobilis TaxID=692036 RepID=A0A6C2YKY2_9BACT|nr:hypothetical protein [Tuwongella immobilis]VIP01773.1 unnamed protein product [Tuwongella immobilis]VTR99406.1 unnamed protein product [Tuwongella immobilis]
MAALTYEHALAAAHQHLWSCRPPPEWVWRLPVGERVAGGWYFACTLEPLRLIDDGLGTRFGGQSGFVVLDTGGIRPAYRVQVADAEPGAAADGEA